MCKRAVCKTCSKITWIGKSTDFYLLFLKQIAPGSGKHISDVMLDIPYKQRCHCAPDKREPSRGDYLKRKANPFAKNVE